MSDTGLHIEAVPSASPLTDSLTLRVDVAGMTIEESQRFLEALFEVAAEDGVVYLEPVGGPGRDEYGDYAVSYKPAGWLPPAEPPLEFVPIKKESN